MLNRYLLRPIVLLGDMLALALALLTALFLRAQALPQADFLAAHMAPFVLVLLSSILVYFVAGLYDLQTLAHRRIVFYKIVYAQVANVLFATLFFYFITIWGITPKTILLLYIVLSFLYMLLWRTFVVVHFAQTLPKDSVYIFANKQEGSELANALHPSGPHPYSVAGVYSGTLGDSNPLKLFVEQQIANTSTTNIMPTLVLDMREAFVIEANESIYQFVGQGGQILSFSDIYESVFDKIPEGSLSGTAVLPYMYSSNKGYDSIKRLLDIVIALPLFVLSLLVYPLVYLGIKVQDRGPVFFVHDRVGRGGKRISLYKFRSMTFGDTSATWVKDKDNTNKVTKLGHFLRKSRIDELPQLWNVLRGDMSLVGPRPDVWAFRDKLLSEIPYYNARYVAVPGLSGWAQTHMTTPPQTVAETKERLLYDLYYIKYRSLFLDLLIALKTIKTLLSREGM
jgi:exopolysaccharide biosynthesis polyprenyl glycosylphosphotransferase